MIEIVVARHSNENVSWLGLIRLHTTHRITLYNKGSPLKGIVQGYYEIGQEVDPYLHHIVTRWDTLADWTIFSSGNPSEFVKGGEFAKLLVPVPVGLLWRNPSLFAASKQHIQSKPVDYYKNCKLTWPIFEELGSANV